MNQMTMAGLNAGNAAFGGTPMLPNGSNGAAPRPAGEPEEVSYEAKLNAYIYGYFIDRKQWDSARALKNSGAPFFPTFDANTNGADEPKAHDSKNGLDPKRPDDLPEIPGVDYTQGGSFLLGWFSLFWDIYWAQRPNGKVPSKESVQYVNQSQAMARQRNDMQQQILRNIPGMMPGQIAEYQRLMMPNGMQMDGNLRHKAMQNNRNGFPPNHQQMAAMRQNQVLQQQMRRDPSDMNRPRTPSAGDHAPSPSKRQRMDGAPFNGQQMLQNGRLPGVPGQMMGQNADHANQLLMNNGINPGNLSDSQFLSFQQQNPSVQQKSIQVYAQNLAKNQRDSMSKAGGMSDEGSPLMGHGMDIGVGGPDFYGSNNPAAMQMRAGGVPPNPGVNGAGGNHALQDYQMQLMLLEQQNKKRLLMARQEQDTVGRPDVQPGMAGFATGMSPQGSRGGPSPGPGEQARRGTPKMNQPGLPGSPLPDGSMRGSPAAMNFNGMTPDMYAHMNGGGMRPPSSNPGFNNGQFNPQQLEQMRAAGRMTNGGWQQGPQGQGSMMPQGQPPQPSQMGTPQQRNEMPPPQGPPPGAAANGRPGSPAAPPTPQQTNKTNPKKEKQKERKKPTKKGSTASVAATPASEPEQPPTPTPATPVTPSHPNSFATKNDQQAQTNGMPVAAPQLAQLQPDPASTQFASLEDNNPDYSMQFNNDPTDSSVLETFDFEQFLQGDAFNFDATTFDMNDGIEANSLGE